MIFKLPVKFGKEVQYIATFVKREDILKCTFYEFCEKNDKKYFVFSKEFVILNSNVEEYKKKFLSIVFKELFPKHYRTLLWKQYLQNN